MEKGRGRAGGGRGGGKGGFGPAKKGRWLRLAWAGERKQVKEGYVGRWGQGAQGTRVRTESWEVPQLQRATLGNELSLPRLDVGRVPRRRCNVAWLPIEVKNCGGDMPKTAIGNTHSIGYALVHVANSRYPPHHLCNDYSPSSKLSRCAAWPGGGALRLRRFLRVLAPPVTL